MPRCLEAEGRLNSVVLQVRRAPRGRRQHAAAWGCASAPACGQVPRCRPRRAVARGELSPRCLAVGSDPSLFFSRSDLGTAGGTIFRGRTKLDRARCQQASPRCRCCCWHVCCSQRCCSWPPQRTAPSVPAAARGPARAARALGPAAARNARRVRTRTTMALSASAAAAASTSSQGSSASGSPRSLCHRRRRCPRRRRRRPG
jgi:hypothetical protein